MEGGVVSLGASGGHLGAGGSTRRHPLPVLVGLRHGAPSRSRVIDGARANWNTPADVKAQYGNASILKNGPVVFNIGGNKYRLVVAVKYSAAIVFVRFIGTHQAYDQINAEEI